MNFKFVAALAIGASFASMASAQYKLGGPESSLTPSSSVWSWDGSNMTGFRGALENPNYFGPGGASSTPIATSNLSALDDASLAGLDGLVLSWMWDIDTTPDQEAAIQSFFFNGGDLLLLDDGNYSDRIAELLGLPTSNSSGTVSNGSGPQYDGVFGHAANVFQGGDTGQLSEADILAKNGTIGGFNLEGQITSAFWAEGQYAAGAGKLLIVADVDMFSNSNAAYGTTLGDLNDNGRFALNSVDWMVNGQPVPEPATMAVLGLGALGLLKKRRRK